MIFLKKINNFMKDIFVIKKNIGYIFFGSLRGTLIQLVI
jgi:hypothetical protein